ncbi:gluconate 2-dehydrogenase subunit 3 family protein [Brevibacterium sp. 50QC2O2]|jgi:hypothetical protein|uniref:gluconate 2-dehydrogenase subunit 3 family protein n=1 Tax=Brevibacterium TaxID=1696 RepID=UPI00211C80BE|nr:MULTISPECIES: gluconate 2-dehydrogenase subunit 3 family protein [unclassified Brevibacterium]MCQ9368198.1 gluconate 2-dehydrogenase subunit 3 family protein [Brevibacterium sp. 91QC2O2]MCQ9385537.1 gluconate 2-dehydrogenase subunit 3 family protein [Brevibacterium sp. 68QC2CO]MCQ9389900.1 gluconate 2-dehydrogenase subunit 3 family protein [Brevibacterium sp. 50QC2O2]
MSEYGPLPSKYPQLNQMEFTPQAKETLVHIIRTAFPHKNFPDGPYQRMAERIIEMADESRWFRLKLIQGVQTLDSLAGGSFTSLAPDGATAVLKQVERTEFFGFIRRSTVLEMYEDEEVWQALGYEGPSFDQGGYINRGFNDLDWLDEPRVEESAEVMPDLRNAGPVAGSVTESDAAEANNAGGTTGSGAKTEGK